MVVAGGGGSKIVGISGLGTPVMVGRLVEVLRENPVEPGSPVLVAEPRLVGSAVEFEKTSEVDEAKPDPVPRTSVPVTVLVLDSRPVFSESMNDEEDDDASVSELKGLTTGLPVVVLTREDSTALWRSVPVDVDVSKLSEGKISVLEDTGSAEEVVEVTNVEASTGERLDVDDDNDDPEKVGMSEHSASVSVAIVVDSVAVALSVVLLSDPSEPDSSCLGSLPACARRHGRFLRGPASAGATSNRACNIIVVIRILAVSPSLGFLKTRIEKERNRQDCRGGPARDKKCGIKF